MMTWVKVEEMTLHLNHKLEKQEKTPQTEGFSCLC